MNYRWREGDSLSYCEDCGEYMLSARWKYHECSLKKCSCGENIFIKYSTRGKEFKINKDSTSHNCK